MRSTSPRVIGIDAGATKTAAVVESLEDGAMERLRTGPSAIVGMPDARALAVLSDQRVSVTPDVPTAKEQGFDVVVAGWHGLLAPTGTPRPIIQRLNKHWVDSATSSDVKGRLEKLGFFPRPGTPGVKIPV